MRNVVLAVLLGLFGLVAYIRFAPSDPAVWNVPPDTMAAGDYPGEGRFLAVRYGVPAGTLDRLTAIALATPRTTILAGSAQDGMVTFVTRSALWGFPDYTTARLQDDTFAIFGRLRFGRGDMGVNEARIKGWLAALGL